MSCQATIQFGDDFGDNVTTFHCRLEQGHEGNHIEKGNQFGTLYSLEWKDSPTKECIEKWNNKFTEKDDEQTFDF